jgi:hypothetical protein
MKPLISRIIPIALLIGSGCAYSLGAKVPPSETVAIGACDPTPCTKVRIDTLPALPPSFTDAAREKVTKQVDEALYAPLDDAGTEASRDGLIESVRAQFDDYLQEKDPDVVVDWSVERSASLIYSSAEVVSVAVKNRGFLGGAHGFDDERLFVFDAKSGAMLTWDDLISSASRSVFLKAAEAEFRRVRGLAPGASLSEAGFTFEKGDDFELPTNFALTDKGIVCHYNPYEVGPYVMGATDFVVPMDVVRPALTSQASLLLGRKEESGGLL